MTRTDFSPYVNSVQTNSWTTGSYTLPANAKVLIACHAISDSDASLRPSEFTLTASDGTLTLTPELATGNPAQWGYGVRVWSCTTDGSTVSTTFTFGTGTKNAHHVVVEPTAFVGYDAGTPIGGTATGTDTDGDGVATLTLSAAPASGDHVMAYCSAVVNSGSGAADNGAGWTELSDDTQVDYGYFQAQVRTGSTSSTVTWADVCNDASGAAPLEAMLLAITVKDGGGAPSGPTIDTQPSNQTVTTPATATFTVAATTSGGSLTYQWQRSTDAGTTWSNVSTGTGGTTNSYTTPATSVSGGNANNGDEYRCRVSDTNGTTDSSAATLTVNASGPTINTQPSNQTVTATSPGTFTVSATASAGSLIYQWQRSTDSGSTWADVTAGTGGTTASYNTGATSVTGGTANNGDEYHCVVTDSNGSVTTNAATLTVNAAGVLTTDPLEDTTTAVLLTSTTIAQVSAFAAADLATVVASWTSVATDGSGVLQVSDGAITSGNDYVLTLANADGTSLGICKVTAT